MIVGFAWKPSVAKLTDHIKSVLVLEKLSSHAEKLEIELFHTISIFCDIFSL